ncbi:MAG: organomercurial lyase [Actinomycetota bacterium]
MTEQTRVAELEAFDQGWLEVLRPTPFVRLVYGLAGLTRLGERPAPLDRLAAVLGRSVNETTALVRENTTARIEGGLIHWDEPFPGDWIRRMLYVGDREIPMRSGCAPDLPLYAAVLDVPFRVEDTCAATGVPIRVDFVPDSYERVEPPETVTVLLPVGHIQQAAGGTCERINANVCTYQPFFASSHAATGWLRDHPGGRVFTIAEMFERSWYKYFRDNLQPLIHAPSLDNRNEHGHAANH